MPNFFQGQPINPVPNPEPAGFDLLRQMLMNRSFQGNANPYGMSPGGSNGRPVYTNGPASSFDPRGGGGMSGGPGGQGGQGWGGIMQMLQQYMQQGGGQRGLGRRNPSMGGGMPGGQGQSQMLGLGSQGGMQGGQDGGMGEGGMAGAGAPGSPGINAGHGGYSGDPMGPQGYSGGFGGYTSQPGQSGQPGGGNGMSSMNPFAGATPGGMARDGNSSMGSMGKGLGGHTAAMGSGMWDNHSPQFSEPPSAGNNYGGVGYSAYQLFNGGQGQGQGGSGMTPPMPHEGQNQPNGSVPGDKFGEGNPHYDGQMCGDVAYDGNCSYDGEPLPHMKKPGNGMMGGKLRVLMDALRPRAGRPGAGAARVGGQRGVDPSSGWLR